jgi:hypothetical protein
MGVAEVLELVLKLDIPVEDEGLVETEGGGEMGERLYEEGYVGPRDVTVLVNVNGR